jgi:hypothetical protein
MASDLVGIRVLRRAGLAPEGIARGNRARAGLIENMLSRRRFAASLQKCARTDRE